MSFLVFVAKKKASLKSERIFLHRYLGGERGYTWWKNNFSKVKWSFWGCKVITATGNRMPLLKTASHNTVSESVASLTFFFPPSALSHTIKFTSFSIPKSSTLYAEARLVTSFFFLFFPPFACWICSLLRSCSSFRTEQLHQCKCRIEEILNCPWSSSKWRWAQSMHDANIS